jgi:ankyrin repeat protein
MTQARRGRPIALGLAIAIAAACTTTCPEPHPDPWQNAATAAIARSLPLLQHSMEQWFEERTCTSCHHQSMGVLALAFARERGFAVDDQRLQLQVEKLGNSPDGTIAALQGRAAINPASGRGFQLLALAAAEHPADERTDAMVHVLAGLCSDVGAWYSQSHRPPLEDTAVTSTALCCRALRAYGPAGRNAELASKVARARTWLTAYAPTTSEERSMRLLGLHWAGAERSSIEAAGRELAAMQREDGGWSQLDGQRSDAYATGQAMVALQQVAGFAVDGATLQRGAQFLLQSQLPDGSWLVKTRRRAEGLPYFESGFPHGEHQFISCAATAWAAMALAACVDPRASVAFGMQQATRGGAEQDKLPPLPRAAAFGSLAELQAQLDAGGDANTCCAGGITPLMLAVHDPRKVELLLARGARFDSRSEVGNSALILAGAAGPLESVELLLAAGADPAATDDEGISALIQAVVAADLAKVRRLLAAGGPANSAGKEGFTLLQLACWQGDVATLKALLAAGADCNRTFAGSPPLVLATIDGLSEIVEALLQAGATVDAEDPEGLTALAWAARMAWGHDRIAAALLAAGAAPGHADKNGRTPRDWAQAEQNEPVLALLR